MFFALRVWISGQGRRKIYAHDCLFDLPTITKTDRRNASRLRNFLIKRRLYNVANSRSIHGFVKVRMTLKSMPNV